MLIVAGLILITGLKLGDKPSYVRQIENKLFPIRDSEKVKMEIEGKTINLEVASTTEAKNKGLMNRESLEPNTGMIFIYSQPRILQFWMKDTLIPLDIIFLDETLEIVTIHQETEPNQTQERYSSYEPSQYVIEMKGGWTKTNSVQVGDQFTIQ